MASLSPLSGLGAMIDAFPSITDPVACFHWFIHHPNTPLFLLIFGTIFFKFLYGAGYIFPLAKELRRNAPTSTRDAAMAEAARRAAMKTLLFLPNAFLRMPTPTRVATTATTLPELLVQVHAALAPMLPAGAVGEDGSGLALSMPVEDGCAPSHPASLPLRIPHSGPSIPHRFDCKFTYSFMHASEF